MSDLDAIHWSRTLWGPHDMTITHDSEHDMGYADPSSGVRSDRCVDIPSARIVVDISADGYVVGVETFGHEVGVWDLMEVLRDCVYQPRAAGAPDVPTSGEAP